MTYVTCPTLRYHPAVVAQKAATLGILSDGRFTLGLGAGENLNEHVVGQRWPAVAERHELLAEAVEIITELLAGETTSYRGDHFQVDSARLWDVPEEPVEIAVAVSGRQSVEHFASLADHLVATEPTPDVLQRWDAIRAGDRPGRRRGAADVPRRGGRPAAREAARGRAAGGGRLSA
jgi:G6PDH family F420-dependent oxidoreductase